MVLVRWVRKAAFIVPLLGVLFLGGYVLLPYYALGPGPARDVEPLIRVSGADRYPSEGRFVLTSVVYRQLTGLGIVSAWLDPDRAVVPRDRVYPPGQTVEAERERSISQMDQSKLDATYVALRELTDYPRERGDGVLVEGVVSGCAADGELFPGDLIRRIDGAAVNSRRQAARAIGAAPSGSALVFDVTVDGEPETVRLVRQPCGGGEDPLVGVSLINNFPIDVRISSGGIGGPSAGLMWALGLYDLLTEGDLAGGRTIAGTGGIALDGTVYAIGGVEEKIAAAADSGASVFLVPNENLEAARAAGDRGMELVPVGTFDDALTYLDGGG
jgi:PDZ domain-containing protein